ncbi:unnamed protein product [Linum trigynum]|uniref:Uncharacterized protein n=1 Tax=Linum trigynum TaxID=586398 RepID=A0AAV2E724_9ROSI
MAYPQHAIEHVPPQASSRIPADLPDSGQAMPSMDPSAGCSKPVKRRARRAASKASASAVSADQTVQSAAGVDDVAPHIKRAPRAARKLRKAQGPRGEKVHDGGSGIADPAPFFIPVDTPASRNAVGMHGGKQDGEDGTPSPAVGKSMSNTILEKSESEDSGMEDGHQAFVIKKRIPVSPSTKIRQGMGGKVSQFAATFEAGLAISQEKGSMNGVNDSECYAKLVQNDLPKEGASDLDEYGSNMTNPAFEIRKCPLTIIEGEVGTPPTPKRQFVEFADDKEKVEEASLKWPQSDK